MSRVLRAQPGMEADVVAGGRVFHAQVAAIANGEVRFNLISELKADPALPITLVMAVYKFDHMEWAIEKATELGVSAVAPVVARRSEKHLVQAAQKRADRWRRIAHEASQQARRSDVPLVIRPRSARRTRSRRIQTRRASCSRSRSVPQLCETHWKRPSRLLKPKCPRLKSRSVPRADGL